MKQLGNSEKERLRAEIHDEIWKIIKKRELHKFIKNTIWKSLAILGVAVLGWVLWTQDTLVDQELDLQAKNTIVYRVDSNNALMTLPDSTSVLLERGSKLSYSADFNQKGHRHVHLEGRAFFDVKRDPARPFVVHSGDLKIQVLGTAFDVNSRNPGDLKVTVQEGSVRVGHNQQELEVLKPQQQLRFMKDHLSFTTSTVKDQQYMQWQFSDDLVFDNVSIHDACLVFARKFGFHFEIDFKDETIRYTKFTTLFKKGESIEHILKSISAFTNTKYVIDQKHNTVTLKN